MGIQDLLPLIIDKENDEISLKVFEGKVLAVDASIYLMKWLASSPVYGAYLMMRPEVDMFEVVSQFWDDFYSKFVSAGIDIILVMDGARNPAKAMTNSDRSSKREGYLQELRSLFLRNDINEVNTAEKLMKNTVSVTSSIVLATLKWAKAKGVRILCAPVEADWQLVQLELSDCTDGSVTEDGDLLPLGSKTVIMKLDLRRGMCCVVEGAQSIRKVHSHLGLKSP